ncbi:MULTISPECIES: Na+/H+ antiporter subunit G [Staphylococcaceae]|uniref:Na(+)/H(+) antiporter subunit G n=2 Tax=Staphylococcaceae TaxID=90964 RepID=A0A1W7A831_9STAP|nr:MULTISPECIES: Na+/H+ antiporter subunit G [Macrococcus]ARQ05779.1 Na(+)/H(+) antiporter subunit G [Macrococcus canis]UBH08651.1 Na+/H+ antiporter subunit G [Macrococcus armenti]UBH10951.1 Na+/H+ antiporter subunit G [Macrococcus armenti]UBH13167.1 Na+/H+ antiporter subunit G [Macrococcus armenti]UBH15423.1 Na+/H+ antiporter subunit G [Macrococcus armenti]
MNVNDSAINIILSIVILTGSVMALISAIGIIKFNDVFTRSHAATKSSTLAVLLTLSGVLLYFYINENFLSFRLILGILFLYLTSPVAGHLITRAAYNSGVEMHLHGKKGKNLNAYVAQHEEQNKISNENI